ncbi:TPA: hypothetical protein TZ704_002105 [Streptococcus suis]|nr:hypothetical protein [Streptococcus suis]
MKEKSLKTAYQQVESMANVRQRMSYNRKVITSGDTVEVYSLKTRQRKGYEKRDAGQKRRKFEDLSYLEKIDAYKRKEVYIKQKRIDVMRLISSNFHKGVTKFLTLTFREHVTDRAQAMDEFKKFMKRLNYQQEKQKRSNVKYLGVIEYTKKGRIHFHVVLFNCGYIKKDELQDIWGNGFIRINRIKGMNGSAVARYVTKYLAKAYQTELDDFEEMIRLGSETNKQKDYFVSRNLVRPKFTYLSLLDDEPVFLARDFKQVKTKEYMRIIYVGEYDDGSPIFDKEKVTYALYEKIA